MDRMPEPDLDPEWRGDDEAEAAADELTEQLQGWDREPKSVAPDVYTQTAVYLGERRDV